MQFRKLCWVFYNPYVGTPCSSFPPNPFLTVPYRKYSLYEASVQDWSEILALAERWTFPEVKALCVRELEKHTILDVDRIVLYHQYHVDQNLLVPCYAALISREYPLTLDEVASFGRQLLIIAYTLYTREDQGGMVRADEAVLRCSYDGAREKITRCLTAIHARE